MSTAREVATVHRYKNNFRSLYQEVICCSIAGQNVWIEADPDESSAGIDNSIAKLLLDNRTVIDLILGRAPLGIILDAILEADDQEWMDRYQWDRPASPDQIASIVASIERLAACDIVEKD